MEKIILSLPTQLYEQLLEFSETQNTNESQAIIQILTDHFDFLARKKQSNLSVNQSDWDNLPDDEPDEILWSFYESKPNKIQEEDFLDEPDEVLNDFLE